MTAIAIWNHQILNDVRGNNVGNQNFDSAHHVNEDQKMARNFCHFVLGTHYYFLVVVDVYLDTPTKLCTNLEFGDYRTP